MCTLHGYSAEVHFVKGFLTERQPERSRCRLFFPKASGELMNSYFMFFSCLLLKLAPRPQT